ncbi:MAG: nuclear transport factor 2 family protein, partial [Spongiibacteraceae bacterium]
AMDDRDWDTIQSITTGDLKAEFGMGEIQGNVAVIEFIRSFLDNCGTTQHILGNILIDVDGDKATSESYVSDMHLSKDTTKDIDFRTLGNYFDQWSKIDGSWLMTHRIKDNRATVGSLDVFKS